MKFFEKSIFVMLVLSLFLVSSMALVMGAESYTGADNVILVPEGEVATGFNR